MHNAYNYRRKNYTEDGTTQKAVCLKTKIGKFTRLAYSTDVQKVIDQKFGAHPKGMQGTRIYL